MFNDRVMLESAVESVEVEALRVIKGYYRGKKALPMNEHPGEDREKQAAFREEMSILVGRLEAAIAFLRGQDIYEMAEKEGYLDKAKIKAIAD